MRKILAGGGAPPFPPVGKNPIYIYIKKWMIKFVKT